MCSMVQMPVCRQGFTRLVVPLSAGTEVLWGETETRSPCSTCTRTGVRKSAEQLCESTLNLALARLLIHIKEGPYHLNLFVTVARMISVCSSENACTALAIFRDRKGRCETSSSKCTSGSLAYTLLNEGLLVFTNPRALGPEEQRAAQGKSEPNSVTIGLTIRRRKAIVRQHIFNASGVLGTVTALPSC